MVSNLLNLMSTMFSIILIGLFLKRKNIITSNGQKILSDLILTVILPCNIIKAYCVDLGDNIFQKFVLILFVAISVQVFAYILTKFLYNKKEPKLKAVFQYATVCSNAGFIGNPVIEGLYGDLGLAYNSIFLIPARLVMWTAGVSFFSDHQDKKELIKKVSTMPCMVATYIGFLIMVTPLSLPSIILNPIKEISGCCTTFTMMYIGTIIAEVRLKDIIDKNQLWFCSIRLIFMPLFFFVICKVLNIDSLISAVVVILTAMPAGSTTALLAAKYNGDAISATKCVVCTTLLSIITLPIWCYIVSF